MGRSSRCFGLGFLISAVVVAGCGQDTFKPVSRPRPDAQVEPSEKAKAIFFIKSTSTAQEPLAWAIEAQTEANKNRMIFRVMEPEVGESASVQPEIVRKAIADDAGALMVVPEPSAELAKVLAEAESKGIPVVLLGKSIPAPEGSKPFTVIDYGPFEESAKKIVTTLIEALKKGNQPVGGTALVLADRQIDGCSAARVAALKAAASAGGFTKVVELTIDGSNGEEAKKQVREAVTAHPDLAVILTDDPETMTAAGTIREELKGKPNFFVGGFVDFTITKIQIPFPMVTCYAQGRFEQLGPLGVKTVINRLKGQTVPERVLWAPIFQVVTKEMTAKPIPVGTASPESQSPPVEGQPATPPAAPKVEKPADPKP